jgi:transposase InsO family protein
MLSDLKQFQQTCHFCQINATPRTVTGLPQGSLAAFHVLHRVSIDHIGPFPESPNHNKYLLVAIDHFTKYAWVFPVPDNTARITASMLWHHIFSVFGTPEEILTDGASTLVADELRQLYALFHIEPLVSTAYYPQGNGVVERCNGSVKDIITKTLQELNSVSWDEVASASAFAYNQALHRSTGFSPFFLMFGRDVRTPLDILLSSDTPTVTPLADYLLELLSQMQDLIEK